MTIWLPGGGEVALSWFFCPLGKRNSYSRVTDNCFSVSIPNNNRALKLAPTLLFFPNMIEKKEA
jgi:hypothetical protein